MFRPESIKPEALVVDKVSDEADATKPDMSSEQMHSARDGNREVRDSGATTSEQANDAFGSDLDLVGTAPSPDRAAVWACEGSYTASPTVGKNHHHYQHQHVSLDVHREGSGAPLNRFNPKLAAPYAASSGIGSRFRRGSVNTLFGSGSFNEGFTLNAVESKSP